MQIRFTTLAAVWLFCLPLRLLAAEEPQEWILEAQDPSFEVEINTVTGLATATNGVVLRQADLVLKARSFTINQQTGDVQAQGDVVITSQGKTWKSEKVRYNLKSHRMSGEDFKTGQTPFFVGGQVLAGDENTKVFAAVDATVTTDDYAEPGYAIRAKLLIIVPGEYIEANSATLRLYGVPVFYYPHYRRSLKVHPNNWVVTPGYRSLFGPYVLSRYNMYWNEQFRSGFDVNLYQKRGVGAGPDFDFKSKTLGDGSFKSFYIHDGDPGLDPNLKPIRDERGRITFTDRINLNTNLTVKLVARYQSDAQVVRDFYEHEYRKNIQPDSFAEINQLWSNWSLNVLGRPQLNNFFETVERLPDVKLTGLRQQLGISPFYYESESSAGYYRRRFASGPTNDYAATRADTFHQIVLPITLGEWLNLTPRAGGRLTHYGETEGAGSTLTEETRSVFNTGAELSFKASRVWQGVDSRFWDVNGLRHIVQPSINYVFVPHPSRAPGRLPQFDYEVPSHRLLPIEYPDYNAIDSVDSQNVLRFTLNNKLQTKRKDGVDQLVNWALYTDWRLHPRPGQSTFADVFSDLDLKPRSWLTLNSEVRYDVGGGFLREANHTATVTPNTVWSVSLGHRYLREDPTLGPDSGNNLIYSTLYYRFNENWGARASLHFEARDGTMEEQQYSLYRDFRSWTGALTFRVRDQRTAGPSDYTVAVTFSLKAFPRFGLGDDSNKPSLLLGN